MSLLESSHDLVGEGFEHASAVIYTGKYYEVTKYITLTEHFAMMPPASVSGLYFGHPEARYFSVGKVDRTQVESYAKRKGMSVSEAERWLSPNLAYDPPT